MRAEITGGKITKNTRSNSRRPPLLSTLVHFLSAHLYFILFYFAFSSQIRSTGLKSQARQNVFYRMIKGGRIEKVREDHHHHTLLLLLLLPGQSVSPCALWATALYLITKYARFMFTVKHPGRKKLGKITLLRQTGDL